MEVGGRVTLSCSVAGGRPTPELQWHKMEPERIMLPINMDHGRTSASKGRGSLRKVRRGVILARVLLQTRGL